MMFLWVVQKLLGVPEFLIFRLAVGPITSVKTKEPVAALTFDGGPDPRWTPRLLSILDKYRARGTFFVIGKCAQQHPELVRQIVQGGHTVANHSWNHPSFPIVSRGERERQINMCDDASSPYGQRLFRPPYGHLSLSSQLQLLRKGYAVVTWNVMTDDWREQQDAEQIAVQLKSRIKPGSIILLHDVVCDNRAIPRDQMHVGLTIFLDQVVGHYRFVTLPELWRYGTLERQGSVMKADVEFLRGIKMDFGYHLERGDLPNQRNLS